MPDTKSLCRRLCPRYAPFWTAHGRLGMHFMCNLRMSSLSPIPYPLPVPFPLPFQSGPCRTFVCQLCPPPAHARPLLLSAWQKLFKILLLAATSKCQVFTITLPTLPSLPLLPPTLLLLLQFYLILMGFFLPPTAECIKQSQAHGSITHECVPEAHTGRRRPAVCA